MRCTSSFFFTAPPRPFAASTISPASLSVMVFPPRLHFQNRLAVLDGLLEQLKGIVVGGFRHLVHGLIKNCLSRRALAVVHHAGNKFLHQITGVNRIARNFSTKNPAFTWHISALLLLCGFWPLSAVLRAPLLAIFNSCCVERSAYHVIANARQIFHAAAANQHDR